MLQIPPYSYFNVENSRFKVQTLVIMVKSSHFSLLCCFTILNSSQKVLRISWVCFAYIETPFSLKKISDPKKNCIFYSLVESGRLMVETILQNFFYSLISEDSFDIITVRAEPGRIDLFRSSSRYKKFCDPPLDKICSALTEYGCSG